MQKEIPFSIATAAALWLVLCLIIFLHLKERPKSHLPFSAGFSCAPGKGGCQQRAHNIWICRFYIGPDSNCPLMLPGHPELLFRKEKLRQGAKWHARGWKASGAECMSCVAKLRYSLTCHKRALIWFHFPPSDSIFGVWGCFGSFSFCLTEGDWGPMLRPLKSTLPMASRDFLGCSPQSSQGREMEAEANLLQPSSSWLHPYHGGHKCECGGSNRSLCWPPSSSARIWGSLASS